MTANSRYLDTLDALSPKRLPDDKIFRMFLNWAKFRKLVLGYHLILYHQTGPKQGIPTTFDRLPKKIPKSIRTIADKWVNQYSERQNFQFNEFLVEQVDGHYLYRSTLSRMYDIDLGQIILITDYQISEREIDNFIRFFEINISVRKQAIASTLSPPFVDLALQADVQLSNEVGKTVMQAIEANHTHVLKYDDVDNLYTTAYSTDRLAWNVHIDDPILKSLVNRNRPLFYEQNIPDAMKNNQASEDNRKSQLWQYIDDTEAGSVLMFDVSHNEDRYAIVICLFSRTHAVSMTEIVIAERLKKTLADYYRLGHERRISARAAAEAEDVERKARQALLIADIMHDAADDLLAARASIESLAPRNDFERTELESAKQNLRQLQLTARLFRYMFESNSIDGISPTSTLSSGKDYYSKVTVQSIYEYVSKKYKRVLKENKISLDIDAPPGFSISCMEIGLIRAIDNCAKNSIKHLRNKSHVKRKIVIAGKDIIENGDVYKEVSVYDNGPGIEESLVQNVMKPFVSYSGGMGLGLAIASTVCDIHKGRLVITSEWGGWTRIALRLPALIEN